MLRGFLDDNGLEAIGNHGFIPATWYGPNSAGGTMTTADYDRLQTELEFASILGTPYMGTGSDPTSANNRNIEPWTIAGEKWEALNLLSTKWGIQMYTHNHDPAYNFLQDGPMVTVTEDRLTGATIAPIQVRAESGKRLMQHYLDVTNPDLVIVEMDIYWAHVAQHKHRWRYDENGQACRGHLRPAGDRRDADAPVPALPRQGRRPDDRSGGRRQWLHHGPVRGSHERHRLPDLPQGAGAKGSHNPNYEQDNAPGGAADPGRSLRSTAISAANMNGLRG